MGMIPDDQLLHDVREGEVVTEGVHDDCVQAMVVDLAVDSLTIGDRLRLRG